MKNVIFIRDAYDALRKHMLNHTNATERLFRILMQVEASQSDLFCLSLKFSNEDVHDVNFELTNSFLVAMHRLKYVNTICPCKLSLQRFLVTMTCLKSTLVRY